MSLRDSRIINSVHPWLGARLQWLGQVAKIVGSTQSLISGNRTREEQLRLYNGSSARPAAFPGCSQHQYGFAADAVYNPIVLISSKGRPAPISPRDTTVFFNSAARHVGLTLVAGDDGHYQVFNGGEFKRAVVSLGVCNPNPPPRFIGESFPLVGGRIDQFCGPGFTSLQIRPTGFICGPERFITSLPGE